MLICDQKSVRSCGRWTQNDRHARTACADATEASLIAGTNRRSRRAAYSDIDSRQMRIDAAFAAADINADIRAIPGPNRNWFWQDLPTERLFRCPGAQRAMRALGIVPIHEVVQTPLNVPDGKSKQHQSRPAFEGPKKSFDFSVQIGTSHSSANMPDSLAAQRFTEMFSELASVVTDDELWLAALCGGAAHQRGHVARTRRSGVDLQSQQLSRKPIQNSRDDKGKPEHTNLRQIGMPDMVGLLRCQQIIWFDSAGSSIAGLGFMGGLGGLASRNTRWTVERLT